MILNLLKLKQTNFSFGIIAERLRGEIAKFDISDKKGNLIIAKDKRITVKHIREIEKAGVKTVNVDPEFLLGRNIAKAIIDTETGEVIIEANTEITQEIIEKLLEVKIKSFNTLYSNDLDHGNYISQTLASDEVPDQYSAKVAIYRMMRPGEPPTEDSVQSLFEGLFFNPDRYDLSNVGRMKFNRRAFPGTYDQYAEWLKRFYEKSGPKTETGEFILSNEDILSVVGMLIELRNGRGGN